MAKLSKEAATMSVNVDIFAPRSSIRERFPDVDDGLELVEAIFGIYGLTRSATLSFYDAKGNRSLVRHPVNMRGQQQVLRKYATCL